MKSDLPLWHWNYLGHYLGAVAYEQAVARYLAQKPDPEILDVGCGNARWRRLFPAGVKYTGMDIEKREGVDVVASAEAMPFAEGSFDLLFSNAVLEHIQDVPKAVSEMLRVVRSGGSVILGTHGVWPIHGEPHDYRRWTPYGLAWEFRHFSSVRVTQVGGPFSNALLILNNYLRAVQDRMPPIRILLSPLITLHNLLGRTFPGDSEKRATLATFYVVEARK